MYKLLFSMIIVVQVTGEQVSPAQMFGVAGITETSG